MRKNTFILGAALVAGLLVAAPTAALADTIQDDTTTETIEVVDVAPVEEIQLEQAPVEEAPVVEVVAPVVEDTAVKPDRFVPYTVDVRWIIPASWAYDSTPYYTAAIFPQTLGDTIPCGQWSQDDRYLLENPGEEKLLAKILEDGILTMGEDSSIYLTHVFTKGDACVVPPVEVIPVTPTITQATGSCIDETWVEQAATITYPVIEGGRWENGLDGQTVPLPAGEYADRFTTAEGNYTIPEGGDYYLDNGWAVFSYTIAGLPAEDCTIPEEPTTPEEPTVVEDIPVVEEQAVLASAIEEEQDAPIASALATTGAGQAEALITTGIITASALSLVISAMILFGIRQRRIRARETFIKRG